MRQAMGEILSYPKL